MKKISGERFEDIEAWRQSACELARKFNERKVNLKGHVGHAEIYPSTLWKTLDMYIPAIYSDG
jgi:hypothetical protein